MATMAEVAKEAGVSVATVSRLLNNEKIVNPETAARIYDAIKKLSYEPNIMARNLRKNESRVIIILSPNVTNPYYAHILSGIGDVATKKGYSALICTTNDDLQVERETLDMLKKRRADGAILMASNVGCNWLLEYSKEYPIVQCSEYDPEVNISRVSIDNYKATQDAMEYLIENGHKRIAIISSENSYISTQLRLKAYKDTLTKAGLPIRDEYIRFAAPDYSYKSGKKMAHELLDLDQKPTAIFCISDTLALGTITAIKDRGLKVPEDISVMGFDDVEHTTMFHPYITTIAQPCYEIGKQTAMLLCSHMADRNEVPRQIMLDHKLIVRESSAPVENVD